mgnify:CR=1 FL=1|tara:strand:+ start:28297 stop:28716 length:420 start_codon:yes stop_codon:yes gene_type:complete
MINRINELLEGNKSFAFETTLSSKTHKKKILKAKKQGYTITILFFWLNNIELAKERVKIRVQEGGHNIPENVIERRYIKGIINLFENYLSIVDSALIFDNSFGKHELIAQKFGEEDIIVSNEGKFHKLKEFYDKKRKTT